MDYFRGWLVMITQIMISSYLSKASITYHDVAFNTANLTTYTFSNQPIGDAEPDRYVFFVAAIHRNAATTATATINGVSAVLVHSGFNTTSLLCIFRSASPIATGTTADISITANGACNSCGIAVYTGVGIKNITPQNTYSSIANPPSFTVTVPSDGFLLAAAFTINGTASFT